MPEFRRKARWLTVVAACLLACGTLKVYFGLIRPAADVVAARSWVEAPVRSFSSQILPFHGILYANVEYVYEYRGRRFAGARFAFTHPTSYLDDDALFALDEKPPPTCFVDPSKPWRSVLDRTLPLHAFRPWGLAAVAVGAALLMWLRVLRTNLQRAALSVRIALRFAGLCLLGFGLWATAKSSSPVHVVMAMFFVVPSLGLLWLDPAWLRVAGVLAAVPGGLSCGFAACPFALMESPLDDLHDPGFALEFIVGALAISLTLWAVALLASIAAMLGEAAARTQASLSSSA